MIEWFRKILGIKRELDYKPSNHPIFLTGCMRSGTTFLANLLTEHPELLHLEGELLDVWTEIGGLDCKTNRVYADRNNIETLETVSMASYFENCILEFSKPKYFIWRIINRMKKGSGGIKKDWNNIQLLNKNVHLINRLDYVMNMFSESRVILVIRSIESQVNSIKLHFEKMEQQGTHIEAPSKPEDSWISHKSPQPAKWDVKDLALKWIELNKTAITDLQKNKNRFVIVSYDNLVLNPNEELTKIYQFLGFEIPKFNLENTIKDRKTFNTNTGGNPLNDWKQRLNTKEIDAIEKVKVDNKTDFDLIQSFL